MISKLLKNPRVITQALDEENGIREEAIAASTDASGLIILNQCGEEILINPHTVNDLIKVLKELRELGGSQ